MTTIARICFVVGVWVCLVSTAAALIPDHRWTLTERLREEQTGHPHYDFSTSFHSFGRTVAIGSVSANLGKGEVRIMHDSGNGLKTVMTLSDSDGIINEQYGAFVRLFIFEGGLHLAVSATAKRGDGALFLYKQGERVQDWVLQQTIYPPEDIFVDSFGRNFIYDGYQLLVSAQRRYVSGPRFQVSAINWKGTRFFQESTGVEPTGCDPILIYRSVARRANRTALVYYQSLEDGVYTEDFGTSVDLSGDRLVVGASSRTRLKYGHGTDGVLDVTGVTLLDGTAEYNFDTVIVRSGGVLTTERYETLRGNGGFLNLRVLNELIVEEGGVINMTATGFEGGQTALEGLQLPEDGKGPGAGKKAVTTFVGFQSCDFDGSNTVSKLGVGDASSDNGVGRDFNSSLAFAEASGGGGGYGTAGAAGTSVQCGDSGLGGGIYGEPTIAAPQRGSGGGSGHPWKIGSGGGGGRGGGVVQINARRITNNGVIESNGGPGEAGGYYSGGGGGGAGGSIVLIGETIANYGRIEALGGRGGDRAIDSGSGGDASAKGGDGGSGRVRLDFLATQSYGIVLPQPLNVTSFLGNVYLYRRSPVTNQWSFQTKVPRLPGMKFIGHSVAIDGTTLVVGSDERTLITPLQSVYIMDIRLVQNETSPISRWREIPKPELDDYNYGNKLQIQNQTMIITAPGNVLKRGIVWVHQSRDIVGETQMLTELQTRSPAPEDLYGTFVHLAFPELYVQLPVEHDDNPPTNARRSMGQIQLFKWQTNISVADSDVFCDFASITANVTLNCTVTFRDSAQRLVGDINEIPYITPAVDFRSKGIYTFQVNRGILGPYEVIVEHKHQRVKSFHIAVTSAIVAQHTNFTCVPITPKAGDTVTCTIYTSATSGDEIAKKDFDVIVYNLNDANLQAGSFDTLTPQGVYRSPPPLSIQTDVLPTDYPVVMPSVTFVRYGVFSFTYTAWREGTFAAFAMYKRVALQFPNPVLVHVRNPPVSPSQSFVNCPQLGAVDRTLACIVTLRGATSTPAGVASMLSNFTNSRYVTAKINNNAFPINAVWSGEGRISLLIRPNITGHLVVKVNYRDNDPITVSPTFTDIRTNYQQTCASMSLLRMSWQTLNQHALSRSDPIRFGTGATRAQFLDGIGMCDDWKL